MSVVRGVFEAADGAIGLGTTTPFDRLHVRYDNNTGDFTGLAVQNPNGGALSIRACCSTTTPTRSPSSRATTTSRTNTGLTTSRGSRRWSVQRLDQLHARRHVKFLVAATDHRHRHDHAVALLEVSNVIPGGLGEHVDDQLHERRSDPHLHGAESPRHGRPRQPPCCQRRWPGRLLPAMATGRRHLVQALPAASPCRPSQNWTDTAHGTRDEFFDDPKWVNDIGYPDGHRQFGDGRHRDIFTSVQSSKSATPRLARPSVS